MELIHKYKRIFLLIGMGICIIAMAATLNENYRPSVIVRSIGRVIVPLQSAASSAASWVGTRVSFLWEMNHLQQEVSHLRDQVGLLELENQRLRLAGEENERLTELLYIRERYGELPTIGARIVARDPSAWYYSFTIDRGANDGISRNMAVLGPGGLVGFVQEVFPTHSRITSILDDHFAVAVQTVRTEDQGVVWGDSGLMQQGLVRMIHISQQAHIMAGDEVITSTLGMFPPGIRVGTIIDVQPTPDGLAQYAIVSPAADVRRLEHVLIVTQLVLPEDEYVVGS